MVKMMGLFSKKEKTQEEKLVNELVGTGFLYNNNLVRNELLDAIGKDNVHKSVKKTWKNGGTVPRNRNLWNQVSQLDCLDGLLNKFSPNSSAI